MDTQEWLRQAAEKRRAIDRVLQREEEEEDDEEAYGPPMDSGSLIHFPLVGAANNASSSGQPPEGASQVPEQILTPHPSSPRPSDPEQISTSNPSTPHPSSPAPSNSQHELTQYIHASAFSSPDPPGRHMEIETSLVPSIFNGVGHSSAAPRDVPLRRAIRDRSVDAMSSSPTIDPRLLSRPGHDDDQAMSGVDDGEAITGVEPQTTDREHSQPTDGLNYKGVAPWQDINDGPVDDNGQERSPEPLPHPKAIPAKRKNVDGTVAPNKKARLQSKDVGPTKKRRSNKDQPLMQVTRTIRPPAQQNKKSQPQATRKKPSLPPPKQKKPSLPVTNNATQVQHTPVVIDLTVVEVIRSLTLTFPGADRPS